MDLYEELIKKYGFIYLIDDEYYYIGNAIFEKVSTSGTSILQYERFIKALDENNHDEVAELYNKIIIRAGHHKGDFVECKLKLKEFIDGLNEIEHEQLSQQLKRFIELFKSYGYKK